ncbi:ATP-binding protein [Sphingomonas sp. LY160]|uniref:ATP-binding protein n=1 Tax=Sphingomonas sp. LY160 TaxID=3095342 RepID=UPI002ADEB7A9|nr:ATP-binding protein [Sphingomonas sp. LY160]MEA1073286.1 response regulator [Sphingomonas sp. LY160]
MPNRVLILAPRGRDAIIAASLLDRNGIDAFVCADHAELLSHLNRDSGAVLLTEEALTTDETAGLFAWVSGQAPWADQPFIVLANGTRSPRTSSATQRLNELGNVVLLERPLHAEAMVGAVRSALKARARQYELRDAASTLERAVVERTAELAAAHHSLEIALEAAEMGSWEIDLATGRTRRTRRHDEIFGYPELQADWSVDDFLQHVDEAQRADISAAFEDARRTGVFDVECSITGADGKRRCIAVKGRVSYDRDGTATKISGVVSDITARKEADAQLAQAQKMDAIGQLTGGVAHDFNNLLTPIVGNLDLIRRRHSDDDRTQRMIGGALQAAERAATLTQRLLSFARRQSLQPRAVDIGGLLDGLADLIRRSLGPTISVVIEVPQQLSSARVDPNQLELALLNLAINARDAMPSGGKLVVAVTQNDVGERNALGLEKGNYVRIVASDTGVGMDQATLARATEPFFSTKGVGKGTGLGLSMVHGLAAQSGGVLTITSEPGKGTLAELWLPTTSDEVSSSTAPQLEPARASRAATIMLVDDEELVRTATAEMLRDVGYTVVEASSGSQAIASLKAGIEADILVTDYLMPGMNGGQLIQELRANGNRMPSLLVTGYTAAGDDVPNDVELLAKPFRQVELTARVAILLQPKKGRDRVSLHAVK